MKLRKDLFEIRKKDGVERNAVWQSLSTSEKIASLDRRLGKGLGAKRQRAKLSV